MSRWHSPLGAMALVGIGVASTACGDDNKKSQPPYDLLCPKAGTDCPDSDGPLLVGVAVRDITPTIVETFWDCGVDQLCPGDEGYPGPDDDGSEGNAELDGHPFVPSPQPGLAEAFDDANGNGVFDAVWIAGFGNGRPAQGVHDPIWARALVLRTGGTTLALVAVDTVGYFYDEVLRVREALDPALGVDLLLVSASHTHESADTVGIWGFDEGTTGVDPVHMALIRQRIIEAVTEATETMTEARLIAAVGKSGVHPDPAITAAVGVNNLIRDTRDPVVIDEEMRILRFLDESEGSTIATLINWSNHPESLCDRNRYISSDFVHWLREGVENGIDRGGVVVPGVGGTVVFVNGAVGGMQSPGSIEVYDLDGTLISDKCSYTTSVDDPFFARPRAFGELAALDALRILSDNAQELNDTPISFATRGFRLPVENWGYHAMFLTGVFYERSMYDWDETKQITDSNLPKIETEVAVINLGPVQAITAPGEMLPEWFVGGYDGSATGPSQDVIDRWHNKIPPAPRSCADATVCAGAELAGGRVCGDDNCMCHNGMCLSERHHPPALDLAPGPPYLRDRMTGEIKMVFGLTPDELGYIIPPFDFILDERSPYVEEAFDEYYEETNSIGVQIGPEVERHLTTLIGVLSN
ncbi:neutral/alkaline non-lysosomal ceramidase N-terminal domain-containing protein [Myxococcota bacterium]